jgi:hypothetical protein
VLAEILSGQEILQVSERADVTETVRASGRFGAAA